MQELLVNISFWEFTNIFIIITFRWRRNVRMLNDFVILDEVWQIVPNLKCCVYCLVFGRYIMNCIDSCSDFVLMQLIILIHSWNFLILLFCAWFHLCCEYFFLLFLRLLVTVHRLRSIFIVACETTDFLTKAYLIKLA